jgi:hypothetical protein
MVHASSTASMVVTGGATQEVLIFGILLGHSILLDCQYVPAHSPLVSLQTETIEDVLNLFVYTGNLIILQHLHVHATNLIMVVLALLIRVTM